MTKRTAEWTRRDRSCTCYHPHPGGRHTVDCEHAWLKAEEQRRADKAYGSQPHVHTEDGYTPDPSLAQAIANADEYRERASPDAAAENILTPCRDGDHSWCAGSPCTCSCHDVGHDGTERRQISTSADISSRLRWCEFCQEDREVFGQEACEACRAPFPPFDIESIQQEWFRRGFEDGREHEASLAGPATPSAPHADLLTVAREVYDEFLNGRIYEDHDESTALLGRLADAIKSASTSQPHVHTEDCWNYNDPTRPYCVEGD